MSLMIIDFRGESLRIVSRADGTTRRAVRAGGYSLSDQAAAVAQLEAALKEIGGRQKNVRVILPGSLVQHSTFQLPALPMVDAEKVVRREVTKQLGSADFSLAIRQIGRQLPNRQDILAEYIRGSDLKNCLAVLRACGIRPTVLTTGLAGISRMFTCLRPGSVDTEAVMELDGDFIEIAVFAGGLLANYKKVRMAAADSARPAGQDLDRAQAGKIKIYAVVDTLYNFMMETAGGPDGTKISHLWISGLGSQEEGLAESITQSLAIASTVMLPPGADAAQAGIYAAAEGLAAPGPIDPLDNLLSKDSAGGVSEPLKRAIMAAALAAFVVLLGSGFAVMNRMERDLRATLAAAAAAPAQRGGGVPDPSLEMLHRRLDRTRDLYAIFRMIAQHIPPDIVLTKLETDATADTGTIKLDARLISGSGGMQRSSLSKFLHDLTASGKLRMVASPEITSGKDAAKGLDMAVTAAFEVIP